MEINGQNKFKEDEVLVFLIEYETYLQKEKIIRRQNFDFQQQSFEDPGWTRVLR